MRRVPEVVRRVILKTGFGWILLAWGSVACCLPGVYGSCGWKAAVPELTQLCTVQLVG